MTYAYDQQYGVYTSGIGFYPIPTPSELQDSNSGEEVPPANSGDDEQSTDVNIHPILAPEAPDTGSIGTPSFVWGDGYFFERQYLATPGNYLSYVYEHGIKKGVHRVCHAGDIAITSTPEQANKLVTLGVLKSFRTTFDHLEPRPAETFPELLPVVTPGDRKLVFSWTQPDPVTMPISLRVLTAGFSEVQTIDATGRTTVTVNVAGLGSYRAYLRVYTNGNRYVFIHFSPGQLINLS